MKKSVPNSAGADQSPIMGPNHRDNTIYVNFIDFYNAGRE